jgi:hypothetical protein
MKAFHLLAAIVFLCTSSVAESASSWAEIAKWPRFMGGIWSPASAGFALGPDSRDVPRPKVKPEIYSAAMADLRKSNAAKGSTSCTPHGLPGQVGGEFFFTQGVIFLMSDQDYFVARQIHMDVQDHGDPDPTYYGHSIGRWEGDTLVVDTVSFLPQVTLVQGVPGRGKTHIIERYRLVNPNTLELQRTVINPEVLEEPWITTRTLIRYADWYVSESYCEQNNRDAPEDGRANADLEP